MRPLTRTSSTTLDVLRVLCTQAVLVGHTLSFLGFTGTVRGVQLPAIQSLAVSALFLLSGFLTLYAARVKGEGYTFRGYFTGRLLRIYCVLAPALLLVWGLDRLHIALAPGSYIHGGAYNVRTFFANLLMLQDFPIGRVFTSFGSDRPLWTLPPEWFLYMAFGFFYFKLYRHRLRWLIFPLAAFACIVPVYNFFGGRGNGLSFTWLLGIPVYLAVQRAELFAAVKPRALLGLALGCLVLAGTRILVVRNTFGIDYDPLYSLGLAGFFVFALLYAQRRQDKGPGRLSGCARFMAGYCFSLFITHYALLELLQAVLLPRAGRRVTFVEDILCCNLLAMGFAQVFERWLPGVLRKRLRPGR